MKKVLLFSALLASTVSFAQNQVQTETTNMINFAAGRIMELAEAIPSEKYAWSPGDGVRSVAGVCAHVISVNYFFATKLGATLPEGVNPQTVENDLTTKDELMPALKQSTELIVNTIKALDDAALDDKVEFPFPGEYTTMSAILIAQGHCNEHLGQLIAYSRMNGITPPWSKQETK
ncbi:MAG: DinB family protein [Cytophagales bacterium]|nr:DinB family protein [Cytophagales bacterium]